MEEFDHAIVNAFLRATCTSEDNNPNIGSSTISFFCKPPSYYYVLGDWANSIAVDVIKSTTVLKKWSITGNPNLAVLVLNDSTYKTAAREMILSRGVIINVYEKQPNSDIYALKTRITPGNIAFHEELIEENCVISSGGGDSSAQISQLICASVAAVILMKDAEKVIVSVAVSNANQRLISVSSFHDSNDLISLCALMTQHTVRELLLPDHYRNDSVGDSRASEGADTRLDKVTTEKLSQVCKRDNILLTYISRTSFTERNVDARLQELLRVSGDRLLLPSLTKDTLRALGCLLGQVQVPVSATKTYHLKEISPSTIMRLDALALDALHIVSATSETRRGKLPVSIYSWLNQYTASSMGSRLMRQWLLQPSTEIDIIVERQLVLECILDSPVVRDSLHSEVLKACPDMDRLCRRIQCRSASIRELSMLIIFVSCVKKCVGVLQLSPQSPNRKVIVDDFIVPLEEMSLLMGNLVTLLEATVDVTDDNEYRIRPEFDDELEECAAQQAQVRKKIDVEFAKVCRSNDWSQDKVCKCELHASYGFIFRVSRKEDNAIRDNSKLTIVQTNKDGIRFTTDTLTDLSQQYKEFTRIYEMRQSALHQKLMETVETYLPVVDDAKELLARLDVFISWANVIGSSRLRFCRPEMLAVNPSSNLRDNSSHDGDTCLGGEDDAFVVTDLWHPLVEVRTGAFISNNLKLSISRNNTAIITGPNMGGKSTLMRSVGVATVLAQAGCYVPCTTARIRIRDAIMCRIGATDYMSQGVSTFMVEMLETSAILSAATKDTLVIIDELGRGTSTYDGFGLAWAVTHHLAQDIKCTVLFSTHFHELTELANATDGCRVFNLHFGADTLSNGTLQFGYKLLPGACTKSFGIEVAVMAGLPASLIEDAKARAAELEDFSSGDSDHSSNETTRLNHFILSMTPSEEQQLMALATEAASIDSDDLVAVAAFKNKIMASEGSTLVARLVST